MAKVKATAEKTEAAAPAALASVGSAVKSVKKGKLPPKNKSRLPRKQKKAQLKAAGRQ